MLIARRSSEVCSDVGQHTGSREQLAAAARLRLALLGQGTSTQPVNRFIAFHSLSPWRSSTRVPILMVQS